MAVARNIRRWKSKQCACQANTICCAAPWLWPPPRLSGLIRGGEGRAMGSYLHLILVVIVIMLGGPRIHIHLFVAFVQISIEVATDLHDDCDDFSFLTMSVRMEYLLSFECPCVCCVHRPLQFICPVSQCSVNGTSLFLKGLQWLICQHAGLIQSLLNQYHPIILLPWRLKGGFCYQIEQIGSPLLWNVQLCL